MINQQDLFGKCPYTTAQKVLFGKWSILIIYYLSEKTCRFSELQHKIPAITQATLTKQLRSLEEYDLIIRTVYPQVPPKVEYQLSEIGTEFIQVLEHLEIWGNKYIDFYKSKYSE
jgi:DNA-binding HxlR family transcriptional regulator